MKIVTRIVTAKHRMNPPKPLSHGVSGESGAFVDFLLQTLLHTGWPVFFAVAVSAALSGCQNAEIPDGMPPHGPPPVVKIAQPVIRQVTEWDEYTGRIEAVNSVEVRSRVTGYLEKVNFTAGEKVKTGELLFAIDPKPFQAQLNLALAELHRAQSRQELAKNDLARAKTLLKAKAISEEEYDTRSSELREATATVHSAEASVYSARLNLEYTQIRSPIDGRVGRELITAGNLVNGGGSATLLTTIVSTDPVYVYVDADERSILKYKRQHLYGTDIQGVPAELSVSDEADFPHHGVLDYLAPSADPDTGTATIRGVFANPGELLSPGFFARLRIRAGEPHDALLLPDRAIGSDQARRFVWVMKPDKQVEYRRIVPGILVADSMRVVKQGLTAKDWVVIDGLQKVRPGAQVNPERIPLDGEK